MPPKRLGITVTCYIAVDKATRALNIPSNCVFQYALRYYKDFLFFCENYIMESMKGVKKLKKFEFLDFSTADVAVAVYGRKLNDVFENAALAMFEVMTDTKKVNPVKEKRMEVRGHDLKALMFNWLNELLFISASENMVFSKFKVRLDEKMLALNATCVGEKIDPKKHEIRTEIKATTYHKMEIKKSGDGWKAQIIFDV